MMTSISLGILDSVAGTTPLTSSTLLLYRASQITGLSNLDPIATWTDEVGNADATQSSATYQPTYYASRGGSADTRFVSDYMTIAYGAWRSIGTSNFTLEFNILNNSLSSNGRLCAIFGNGSTQDANNFFTTAMRTDSQIVVDWRIGGVGVTTKFVPFTNNTSDRHIAYVRNGTLFTIYVDGVAAGTATIGAGSLFPTAPTMPLCIGGQLGNSVPPVEMLPDSYVSRVKFSDEALWTTNFTPPTRTAV